MKTKIGWKVVKATFVANETIKYLSCTCLGHFFDNPFSDSRLEYGYNKITKRPKDQGPLAVFREKRQAGLFIRGYSLPIDSFLIMKCTYKPSKSKSLFWHDVIVTKISYNVPMGTEFADWVKLIPEERETK